MYPCLSLRYYRGSEAARKLSAKRFLFMTRARTFTYCELRTLSNAAETQIRFTSLGANRTIYGWVRRWLYYSGTCTNVWFTLIALPEASISQMSLYSPLWILTTIVLLFFVCLRYWTCVCTKSEIIVLILTKFFVTEVKDYFTLSCVAL